MSGEDVGQGPVSGDQFDAALRSLIDGAAGEARFTEPSAADRAKQAKQAGKRAAKARKKQSRAQSRAHRRGMRSGMRIAAAITVAVALAGGGLYAARHVRLARQEPTGAAGATPAITPLTQVGDSGPPADPFAGTLAAGWADGAAGIVPPAAKPVGPYSPSQVADAYATVKKLLIAGYVEKSVILGGKPTAFAALLSTQERAEFLRGLTATGVDKQGFTRNTRSWIVAFAPGSTELATDVIKVRGTMSAKVALDSGRTVLRVIVNYVFTYAVQPPGKPWDWKRVVDHAHGSVDFARWDGSAGPLEPWEDILTDNAGVSCRFNDGYIHPEYPVGPHPVHSGPLVNPYSSATQPAGTRARCFQVTGT